MQSGTAGVRPTSWPESLSDQEAVQRLRTLCLGACDGVQDLADDSRYKALRRALLSRVDLRPVAPACVAAEPNLPALVRQLRETKDRGQRREMIRAQFVPLLDEVGASEPVTSSRWTGRVTTATSVTETTEFRFNERRSYPDAIARRIGDRVFAIGRIHYFLIRDLEQQLTGQHSPLRNVRRLEPALWTPYLQGEPIRTGTWRAPAKVIRRLAIYHWSTRFESDNGPPSFTAFASFRSARVHLSIYAAAIVLLGAMGSVLAALLSARLRTTVDAEEVQGDLAAGLVVAGLVLTYWLLVSAPWRRIAARTRAGLRRRSAALLSWLRPGAGD
jgi:hypothetical protein